MSRRTGPFDRAQPAAERSPLAWAHAWLETGQGLDGPRDYSDGLWVYDAWGARGCYELCWMEAWGDDAPSLVLRGDLEIYAVEAQAETPGGEVLTVTAERDSARCERWSRVLLRVWRHGQRVTALPQGAVIRVSARVCAQTLAMARRQFERLPAEIQRLHLRTNSV